MGAQTHVVSALVDPADRFDRHCFELDASPSALDHRARFGPGVELVVCVPRVGTRRLQESAPLSGTEFLLLLDQLGFELLSTFARCWQLRFCVLAGDFDNGEVIVERFTFRGLVGR